MVKFKNTLTRRDPIAFDLLVSGTYKQRKVGNKKQYKRNFRNQRDFEVSHLR